MKIKKTTTALLATAVTGLFMGAVSTGCASQKDTSLAAKLGIEKHACKGMNTCKGNGGCKTESHACAGHNECAGKGGCATVAHHECAGKNACKGQGGCQGKAGKNECAGKGGCAVPVKH